MQARQKTMSLKVGLMLLLVVFAASATDAHAMSNLSEVILSVRALPILTIGDTPGFAKSGGMINLILENNRVRFEVNVKAAKDADLNISSRLLALARIVQPPDSDGRKAE